LDNLCGYAAESISEVVPTGYLFNKEVHIPPLLDKMG
jgi:hypothetical protein